jgi:prevent-host-death family protein
MSTVGMNEAKAKLPELVERAAGGEEILIADASGRPVARLMACVERAGPRRLGQYRDEIVIGPDFDKPLPETIIAEFYGDVAERD